MVTHLNKETITHALSRLDWADTIYKLWFSRYAGTLNTEYFTRFKNKCKTEGLINHDRVLHNRKEL